MMLNPISTFIPRDFWQAILAAERALKPPWHETAILFSRFDRDFAKHWITMSRILFTLLFLFLIGLVPSGNAQDRPNILWLTCEDNNVNWVGCYGNPHAETPHIDNLAKEGFQYMHCYANAPVCAPSRSTWITGIHAVSMGTHPMRSRYPIPHDQISYYPDSLKEAGYFVGNAGKTDYNIGGRNDKSLWDTGKKDWKQLQENQPFFMIINNTKSHESKAFGSIEDTEHSPGSVELAKYHPDIPDIRKNYAHYHDQMKKMDADIGAVLKELEDAGLAENTIVVHNSDHGGVIARSKRFLFNSGTHCPLVIRIPEKFSHLHPGEVGSQVDTLVSFIDMPKTWLSLCGAAIPETMQGKVFLGPEAESRDYHVSFRGRMDERCDNVRAIRDRNLLYIRNYMPYAPWGQRLNYLWNMKATQAWVKHYEEGRTDEVTGRFFGTKPMEELYDTTKDPDNVVNLIGKKRYSDEIARFRSAMDDWQLKHFDAGLLPESEIAKRAEDNSLTIYEMVRDENLYPVKSYLEASRLALESDPENTDQLYERMGDSDGGVRYWAVVGLFHLQDRVDLDIDRIRTALEDDSHHVRVMAAWILYCDGEKDTAKACWNDLLKSSSYASLKIFNIVDWIGEGADDYQEAMAACKFSHQGYVKRMQQYLVEGFSDKKEKSEKKPKKK